MIKDSSDLKQMAKDSLKGHWGISIVATVIYLVISLPLSLIPDIGGILVFLINSPLYIGFISFFLNLSRSKELDLMDIFSGVNIFLKSIITNFLIILYAALWSILFIVPGIIALINYSMTYYLLAENNNLKINQAIKLSKEVMKGNKFDFFILQLSFIGWFLLCPLTLGLGFLWLIPYIQTTNANFFIDIKEEYENNLNENLDFQTA
jgi:uncharacterized membrane protein